MFVESIEYYSDDLAQVSIISSATPSPFPASSDDVEGMRDGVSFAPGSTIYVTADAFVYMYSPAGEWVLQ